MLVAWKKIPPVKAAHAHGLVPFRMRCYRFRMNGPGSAPYLNARDRKSIPHFSLIRLVSCHAMLGVLLAVFSLALNAAAQTSNPSTNVSANQKLSLIEAKNLAYQRNWDLLAAKSGIDAATAQLIVSKEFPNPSLLWSTARIGSHDAGTANGNDLWNRNYDTIAQINQLIEIAGKRHDRQVAARAGVAGAQARFFDARRTLDQGVTKAYVAALLAEANVKILNESSGFLQHEAGIAEARFKAGDLSDSDKKQIEINAEQFELQAKSAEATAAQARIAVEILLGRNEPKGEWTPSDSLDDLVSNNIPAMGHSGGARPDVLAAEEDLRGGQAQLKLQKALRVPDPTFSVGIEHNPPGGGPGVGPDVNSLIAGFSLPIPLWNLNGGNIHAAQASVNQFEYALGKLKAQASADVANAEVAYHEASTRLQRYHDQTGPKSASVRESVQFAYNKGGASLVNLLDAEKTDNDIRMAVAQAMSDTASAAADLAAARNVLSESELAARK
jgi:cobalt-zinc-cadmium efflux system outer membrane protein